MKSPFTWKLIPNLLMTALINFKAVWKKNKKEVDECHQKILYLEAYSRRENRTFEGIAEASQNNATSTQSENPKAVLVGFLENVLGIEDAKNMEFQRLHRLGMPKNDNGNGGRTIISRFLRFLDR